MEVGMFLMYCITVMLVATAGLWLLFAAMIVLPVVNHVIEKGKK